MTVELTTQPQTEPQGHEQDDDRVFHFCCFGNFSGNREPSDTWDAFPVNRNSWDKLFETLNVSLQLSIQLPNVDDMDLSLSFDSLEAFSEKRIVKAVPLLAGLKALHQAVSGANSENPLTLGPLLENYPALRVAKGLAEASDEGQVLDLLNMVDIGEDQDQMRLPKLKALFAGSSYDGNQRSKLAAEIDQVSSLILEQIQEDPTFNALYGRWRVLKQFLPLLNVRLSLVDCIKEDLCDAVFSLCIKPDQGEPQPLDLAFFCDEFADTEPDRHTLFHLGRMADSLAAPFILNASASVFGCKHWRHLTHLRDISGRIASPERVKWRKLREAPGARWLFLALSPIAMTPGDQDEGGDESPTAPASAYPALLLGSRLAGEGWPGELLHPGHQLDFATACLAQLDEQQGYDLAYEGFAAVSGKPNGDRLYLLGMFAFSRIMMPASESLEAANLVEHTLACRFYAGACSRFLMANQGHPQLLSLLKKYAAIRDDSGLQVEEADGQQIYRLKPGFTILGVQPDVVLALDA